MTATEVLTATTIATTHAEAAARDASARGSLTISDRVVERISHRAALEVGEVTAVGTRIDQVIGHKYPKISVQRAGQLVRVRAQVAVAWPAVLPRVAAQVRDMIASRVASLTGLTVDFVDVSIAQMVRTDPARRAQMVRTDPTRRVRAQ